MVNISVTWSASTFAAYLGVEGLATLAKNMPDQPGLASACSGSGIAELALRKVAAMVGGQVVLDFS